MKIENINIETYVDGKAGFIVELSNKINLPDIFNQALTKRGGRPPEIPYGTLAQMMIVNMCDDHHPLSRLDEYYEQKDLEGLFHEEMNISQINDDRFGSLLDKMYEYGAGKLFSEIAANAFCQYKIQVKNINFDTTSKVMWGKYETEYGKEGEISITYGHSKQKRNDKKQLKIGIGAAEGIVVGGKVLSGNVDDKTYNNDNLDTVEELIDELKIEKENFYYIADASLFTNANLKKAKSKEINLITRMTDNTALSKKLKNDVALKLKSLKEITIIRKNKDAVYKIDEDQCNYKGTELKYVGCYSYNLKDVKKKSLTKQKEKEFKVLSKLSKCCEKNRFACKEDAEKEIIKLSKKDFKNVKFHNIELEIIERIKPKRGRPAENTQDTHVEKEYELLIDILYDEDKFDNILDLSCIFILCSTDLNISGEELLREYKTQDSVEKKFKQLKSPQFVNSLFLESPSRIEAMAYLMLITLMILSVAEYVVRRELKLNNEYIIGPGKIKMTAPTLNAIYQVFYSVQTAKIITSKETVRQYTKPLKENIKKIFKCLGISEDALIRSCK